MKNFKLSKLSKTAKIIGAGIGFILLLIVIVAIGNPLMNTIERALYQVSGNSAKYMSSERSMGYGEYDYGYYEEMDAYGYDMATGSDYPQGNFLPPIDNTTTGDTAENFEVTEFYVQIETGEIKEDCKAIMDLKALEYVIFENVTEHEKGCHYTFKVTVGNLEEILEKIEALNPKNLTKSTYTIQRVIEYISNEKEILMKRNQAIEKTLEDALNAYDEISKFATQSRDATALANVVEAKIKMIERLTMEKININERLNRLAQSEEQQKDKLKYTYFYISVNEDKFIDRENIKESWKNSVKDFVNNTNETIQGLSIGLITLLLFIIQYGLYLLILVVIARLFWRLTRKIWTYK